MLPISLVLKDNNCWGITVSLIFDFRWEFQKAFSELKGISGFFRSRKKGDQNYGSVTMVTDSVKFH